MINTQKLSQELVAAGISTHGNCNSSGVVWDDSDKEIQGRADVKAVLAAHDPRDYVAERQAAARNEAALAVDLKTLTPEQAVAYIETKVTTLATAKTAMKVMARMLIAMRDEIWPSMADE